MSWLEVLLLFLLTLSVSMMVAAILIASELHAKNAKLREQMEWLVTLLRVDCDIDASWDGLRRFWSIGLTEDGCLMRDRACKAEAENAKLRELAASYDSALHRMCDQTQGYVHCHDCILGRDYGNEDSCAIDELREAANVVKVEFE